MEKNEVYRIWYDTEEACVKMLWKGYATGEQFRAGTELMYDELVKHGAQKVFGDIKDMILIGQSEQNWLLSDFLPRAIKAGCKFFALVKPDSYFNKVAIETVNSNIDSNTVQIKMFDHGPEAIAWLRSEGQKLNHV